jgi:putative membrane protein
MLTTFDSAPIPPAPSAATPRTAVAAIILVSAAASAFLFWLLYFHHAPTSYAQRLTFLPAFNAIFNGLSASALIVGFLYIRRRLIRQHRAAMFTAFAFSSLFLVSYIVHHALHGDMLFAGHGAVRTLYLSILASHVILSVIALPMILVTFFLSLSGRFPAHRRLARFTFPIWLYVSITGVVVYAMLAWYQ